MKDQDLLVRKHAVICILQIVQREEFGKIITPAEGIKPLLQYVCDTRSEIRIPGLMVMACISQYDENQAMELITVPTLQGKTGNQYLLLEGIDILREVLTKEPFDYVKTAANRVISCVAKHSPDHAKVLTDSDLHTALLAVSIFYYYHRFTLRPHLRVISSRARPLPFRKSSTPQTISNSWIPSFKLHPSIFLKLLSRELPTSSPNTRNSESNLDFIFALILYRPFIESGGFHKIQELLNTNDPEMKKFVNSFLKDALQQINEQYGDEIVNFYDPDSKNRLERMIKNYD